MTCKKQAEAQPIDGLAIVKETSTLGKLSRAYPKRRQSV